MLSLLLQFFSILNFAFDHKLLVNKLSMDLSENLLREYMKGRLWSVTQHVNVKKALKFLQCFVVLFSWMENIQWVISTLHKISDQTFYN